MRSTIGCIVVILMLSASTSSADQMWLWSFAGEQGTFLTDGALPVPGTYTMIDFAVTSSSSGGTLGSVSGGQYEAAYSDSVQPYAMTWNGQEVTRWAAAGFNSFNWWPFADLIEPPKAYLFAFAFDPALGGVNDAHSAALWNGSEITTGGPVTVRPAESPSPTPEPSTVSLLALAATGFGARRARRRTVEALSSTQP